MATAIPEFGVVTWADAATVSGKPNMKKLRKETVAVSSVGKLFLSTDGILLVLHEFKPGAAFQRDVEATVIPLGWVQDIVALTPVEKPKVEIP